MHIICTEYLKERFPRIKLVSQRVKCMCNSSKIWRNALDTVCSYLHYHQQIWEFLFLHMLTKQNLFSSSFGFPRHLINACHLNMIFTGISLTVMCLNKRPCVSFNCDLSVDILKLFSVSCWSFSYWLISKICTISR